MNRYVTAVAPILIAVLLLYAHPVITVAAVIALFIWTHHATIQTKGWKAAYVLLITLYAMFLVSYLASANVRDLFTVVSGHSAMSHSAGAIVFALVTGVAFCIGAILWQTEKTPTWFYLLAIVGFLFLIPVVYLANSAEGKQWIQARKAQILQQTEFDASRTAVSTMHSARNTELGRRVQVRVRHGLTSLPMAWSVEDSWSPREDGTFSADIFRTSGSDAAFTTLSEGAVFEIGAATYTVTGDKGGMPWYLIYHYEPGRPFPQRYLIRLDSASGLEPCDGQAETFAELLPELVRQRQEAAALAALREEAQPWTTVTLQRDTPLLVHTDAEGVLRNPGMEALVHQLGIRDQLLNTLSSAGVIIPAGTQGKYCDTLPITLHGMPETYRLFMWRRVSDPALWNYAIVSYDFLKEEKLKPAAWFPATGQTTITSQATRATYSVRHSWSVVLKPGQTSQPLTATVEPRGTRLMLAYTASPVTVVVNGRTLQYAAASPDGDRVATHRYTLPAIPASGALSVSAHAGQNLAGESGTVGEVVLTLYVVAD